MQFIVLCTSIILAVTGSVIGYQCGDVASMNIIHQTPWLVFMEYYRRGMRSDTRCGGTLVSSRHLVTAAHCVKKAKRVGMVARLGEYDITTKNDCVGEVCSDEVIRIPIEETVVHPGYDGKEHDIAVLKLKWDAPYSDFIRPICLPTGHIHNDTVFVASGWGELTQGVYSQTTKDILLPIFPEDQCRDAYPTVKLPNHIICAGGQKGKDTCRGDSGGPLAWIKDKAELWGVISSGYTVCGTEGKPGIYTSVLEHLNWIHEAISKY